MAIKGNNPEVEEQSLDNMFGDMAQDKNENEVLYTQDDYRKLRDAHVELQMRFERLISLYNSVVEAYLSNK